MPEAGGPRVKRRTVLIATGAGVIALAVPLTALPRLRDGGAPHGAELADVTLRVNGQTHSTYGAMSPRPASRSLASSTAIWPR